MSAENRNNELEGRHMNWCVLIAGLGIQMEKNFTYCLAQCCTWHNRLPQWHADANDPNQQGPSFVSVVANRDLRGNRQGIGCKATKIKEMMEWWTLY